MLGFSVLFSWQSPEAYVPCWYKAPTTDNTSYLGYGLLYSTGASLSSQSPRMFSTSQPGVTYFSRNRDALEEWFSTCGPSNDPFSGITR